MSGQHVPYQLRTNKFVERQLFLDALDFVRIWNGPTKYVYASMGGPFLEDFKLVNDRLAIEAMISIEADELTWRRQQFNCPFGFVKCENEKSGDFVTRFDKIVSEHPDGKFIVWLDYANANERHTQLQELESLATKLASGDVVKATLNANAQSLMKRAEHKSLNNSRFNKLLANELAEQLGEYVPEGGLQSDKLQDADFAHTLAGCVEIAVNKAIENSELVAIPMVSARYKDGEHQMLTVTTLIADESLATKVSQDEHFEKWPFRSATSAAVHFIRVPLLSFRERAAINQLLGAAKHPKEIHDTLGLRLDENEGASLELLKGYLSHYRRYPSFAHVSQ